jgi:pyruvate/2-oxoglutarate dehydrogenase complex dihydrolipoamide dehydrogenase (E3) component
MPVALPLIREETPVPTIEPARDHLPGDVTETTYDVIVLGAGSTGENVADYAKRGGLTALLVESELVGGECSYWACMPSKALLRPVEALADARRVAGAREAVTGSLDVAAVFARRDSFTSGWSDSGQVKWVDREGIALARGHGRLTGVRTVEVDGVTFTARHAVVVCTGTSAALPPVDGLAEADPWTSRDATSASAAPARLVVLGGGVVGVEMAFAWQALGSQVTLLERSDRVLVNNEPEVGTRITKALRDNGVDVRTGVSVTRVVRDSPGGAVTVTLADGTAVQADEVLVAAGRRPRTEDIGLETVGLEPGGWLTVDDRMQVEGTDWLYAAGDVNHRALLTHMGKYQARVAGTVIAARAQGSPLGGDWSSHAATADHRCVPQVVFSDPPVASVGLTEAAARNAGLDVRTVSYEIGNTAGGSLFADDNPGWAQLVVAGDVLVGATFLGPGVTEMVHGATVAIVGQIPLQRLWHAVPSYPTMTEVWLRLLDQLPHG